MALWTAGILLALGLAWLVGAVVVPVWRTRSVVLYCDGRMEAEEKLSHPVSPSQWPDAAVKQLGGPERAARRLDLYLRLPSMFTTRRGRATIILGHCGSHAVPALVRALSDPHENVQFFALRALGDMGKDAGAAVPGIEIMLQSGNISLRRAAEEALGKIRGKAE